MLSDARIEQIDKETCDLHFSRPYICELLDDRKRLKAHLATAEKVCETCVLFLYDDYLPKDIYNATEAWQQARKTNDDPDSQNRMGTA